MRLDESTGRFVEYNIYSREEIKSKPRIKPGVKIDDDLNRVVTLVE